MFHFNKRQRKQACPESAGSGYTPENSLIVLDSSRTLNSPETVQGKKKKQLVLFKWLGSVQLNSEIHTFSYYFLTLCQKLPTYSNN